MKFRPAFACFLPGVAAVLLALSPASSQPANNVQFPGKDGAKGSKAASAKPPANTSMVDEERFAALPRTGHGVAARGSGGRGDSGQRARVPFEGRAVAKLDQGPQFQFPVRAYPGRRDRPAFGYGDPFGSGSRPRPSANGAGKGRRPHRRLAGSGRGSDRRVAHRPGQATRRPEGTSFRLAGTAQVRLGAAGLGEQRPRRVQRT